MFSRPSMFGAVLGAISMLHFSADESNTAVADQAPAGTATPPAPAPVMRTPTALEFCTIYNQSSNREDALKRFKEANLHMTYGAMVARYKSYTDEKREGGAIKLKVLPASPRGKRINASDINAKLAEMVTAQVIKGDGEQKTETAPQA